MKTAILLLCFFNVCSVCAETVQISLPDLTGGYDSGFIEPLGLALDAEMVGADRQTWGQIKAIYRKERQ